MRGELVRDRRRIKWTGWVLAIACAAGPIPSDRIWADSAAWKFNSSYNYWTGKYGTPDRTDTTYIPFAIKRLFQAGDLGLTIPYISVTGPRSVTIVDNVIVRNGSGRSETVTQSGLGDILLKGRYYLLNEGDQLPAVDLTAEIKFPTADSDRGLGTGEFDERLGAGLSKELPERFFVILDGGYTWVGSPPGITLQDRWDYLTGLGFHINKQLSASFNYEEVRALTPGGVNVRDVLYGVDFKATRDTSLSAYLLSGLSSAAPDFGVSLGLGIRFS